MGGAPNDRSDDSHVSADGSVVVFRSLADNLVDGDTNGVADVFLHDVLTGEVLRVSVASDGAQSNGPSSTPRVSGDGQVITFRSSATNLVTGDTNAADDVFVHDRRTGQTTRVSVDSDGNEANRGSSWPSLSGDGRWVAFGSTATNLVDENARGAGDVFVHDRLTGTTNLVSVDPNGEAVFGTSGEPVLSADGRRFVFRSTSRNLLPGEDVNHFDLYVRDLVAGVTVRASQRPDGGVPEPDNSDGELSASGRFVVYGSTATDILPGDTNGDSDIYLYDTATGVTERISVNTAGEQANGRSAYPSVSADGQRVVFFSDATNLDPRATNGRSHIYLRDRELGTTVAVSLSFDGSPSVGSSLDPSISSDGTHVVFRSSNDNLLPDDVDTSSSVYRVTLPE